MKAIWVLSTSSGIRSWKILFKVLCWLLDHWVVFWSYCFLFTFEGNSCCISRYLRASHTALFLISLCLLNEWLIVCYLTQNFVSLMSGWWVLGCQRRMLLWMALRRQWVSISTHKNLLDLVEALIDSLHRSVEWLLILRLRLENRRLWILQVIVNHCRALAL